MGDRTERRTSLRTGVYIAVPAPGEFSAEIAGYSAPYIVDAWRGDQWVLHWRTRTKLGAYWKVWRSRRNTRWMAEEDAS